MKVIAVLNRKGGVGKTTIALHLGRAASLAGSNVLLVDADPQGTLRDWYAAGDGCGMQIIPAETPSALASIPTIKAAYDLVIIDGTAGIHINAAAAVRVADAVLIPVQPSGFDAWATHSIVDLVKARQQIADGSPAAWFVLSRVIPRSRSARQLANVLPDFDLPVLDAQISQRVLYAGASTEGKTVFEFDPSGIAAREVQALHRELMGGVK